jgi:hypothetical protein
MSILHNKCFAASFILLVGLTTASVAQPSRHQQAEPSDCPTFVQGAKLGVTDIDHGVRISIATDQAKNVPDLRMATRKVVQAIEQHEAHASNPDRKTAETQDNDAAFPPMKIEVKDVTKGVVVTIRAQHDSDVSELREQARALDQMWQSSTCINANQSASISR